MQPTTASATSMDSVTGVTTKHLSSDAASVTKSDISASMEGDWSDICAIAAVKLGVANPNDLHMTKFKVDRHKLEQMINTESIVDGMNSAEYFFEKLTTLTETYIVWPQGLKTFDKDPQVQIVGTISEITQAKEHILASLETREPRVTLNMDVSHTDHSHIIGRGGENIKRIMENTSTYIHFPEANQLNEANEKCNQIALYGSLEDVEQARALVRLSAPLLVKFEIPMYSPGSGRLQIDHDTSYVSLVERKFNVEIIFTVRLHSAVITVKGSEKKAAQVQAATHMMVSFSCGNMASHILAELNLNISVKHHEIVKGNNNANVLNIMERTNTTIIFSDPLDMNLSPCKMSHVTIRGAIAGVYKAREQLLGNLPIYLVFDLPDLRPDVATEIMSLSTKYDVLVSLIYKKTQDALPIIAIQGAEKSIGKIYEAYRDILQHSAAVNKAETPELSICNDVATTSPLTTVPTDIPIIPSTTTTAYLTNSNEIDNYDQMVRCSSDGFGNFRFRTSTPINDMLPGGAESYRTFDFDMRRPSNEQDTSNWMAMAIRRIYPQTTITMDIGDTSTMSTISLSYAASSTLRFSGSAAPGAERRPLNQVRPLPNSEQDTLNWTAIGRMSPETIIDMDDSSWSSGDSTSTMSTTSSYNVSAGSAASIAERGPLNQVRPLPSSEHDTLNWMVMAIRQISPETITTLGDMSWQSGDITSTMSTTSSSDVASSSPRFSGSAAPGAERRPLNQVRPLPSSEQDTLNWMVMAIRQISPETITTLGDMSWQSSDITSTMSTISSSEPSSSSPRFSGSAAPGAERRPSNRVLSLPNSEQDTRNWMAIRRNSPEAIISVHDFSFQDDGGTSTMPTTSTPNVSSSLRFSGSAAPGAERRIWIK